MTYHRATMENQRGFKDYVYLFFTGVTMGSADVVPGVSGGTMAFIMGVYQELIDAIKSFDLEVVKLLLRLRLREASERVPWQFLLALGAGIGTAILSLAGILTWLLEHHPTYLYAFFFGLVLASIVAIGVHIHWSGGAAATLIFGTVLAYWVDADAPRGSLENARLLGEVAGVERSVFPVSGEGRVLLYSLAHSEVLGEAELPRGE